MVSRKGSAMRKLRLSSSTVSALRRLLWLLLSLLLNYYALSTGLNNSLNDLPLLFAPIHLI